MKNTVLFAFLFYSVGCGAIKVRDKNQVAVDKVKKVAVVTFSVDQPEPASMSLNLSKGLEAEQGGSLIPQESTHVEKMYQSLLQNLYKNMNWEVLPKHQMVENKGYKKAYKDTMEGWQNKIPPSKGESRYQVDKVMDYQSARLLDMEGRDALIDTLKVDAILAININVELSGTRFMGVGSLYPQSKVHMQLYAKGHEQPIWFDGNIEVEKSEKSVGKTAFFNKDLLNELSLKSAQSAFQKIGKL